VAGLRIPSWLRDTLRVWMQYAAIGISAIPAGILYVFLLRLGFRPNVALIVSLAFTFVSAYVIWKYLVGYVLIRPVKDTVGPSLPGIVYVQADARLQLVGSLSVIFIVARGVSPIPSAALQPLCGQTNRVEAAVGILVLEV
jgi:hypothetical protein